MLHLLRAKICFDVTEQYMISLPKLDQIDTGYVSLLPGRSLSTQIPDLENYG